MTIVSDLIISLCMTLAVYCDLRIPDEQRLYENLMSGYEKSVRPVINASNVLMVRFGLKLNQIVDLDERHQVLTTNVFIDQEWTDENLFWDPEVHSNIRSLRVPARNVWLPDTFMYNNADDGSTGFMNGTYVLVNYNGTVLWPVPVKLKSSCKVDITYFPFDDQECILRFGSWIYSGLWIDYISMHNDTPIDLHAYVNNSEWDLLFVDLQKNIRTHSCCTDPHPDMTYVLHIRRKTFYYIFNIIVPCIMLSLLTLLTFWLPPTSGEKITLGLSVFLAFSMFMLLIAEEVPATSEAVPLIGIYLCVVMTMTSLSVIMAVMVINLYNRGIKTRRAPAWLRTVTLKWLSKVLCLRHDIDKVAKTIMLEDEQEGAFTCKTHDKPENQDTISQLNHRNSDTRNRRFGSHSEHIPEVEEDSSSSSEVVWLRREDIDQKQNKQNNTGKSDMCTSKNNNSKTRKDQNTSLNDIQNTEDTESKNVDCKTRSELFARKRIVAEWQRIAAVTDRMLFWIYFLGTLTSYIVILLIVPHTNYSRWDGDIRTIHTMWSKKR